MKTEPAAPTADGATPHTTSALVPARSPRAAATVAFGALLLRDLTVLRKSLKEFVPRTLLQPLMLVFIFTYVFPKIGQGVQSTASTSFSTVLIAGVVALVIITQGLQSVAIPMVQEFGYTREIEDRVLAPLPIAMVAMEKVAAGAINALIGALLVFPIAAIIPVTPVHLQVHWLVLLTITPLACITSAAIGLSFGTRFEPRTVPLMFGIVVLPLTFLGAVYYSWAALAPIKWLQIAVLANPLVFISEGFRAALAPAEHMPLYAIYPALIGFAAFFTWWGIKGFRRRVIA